MEDVKDLSIICNLLCEFDDAFDKLGFAVKPERGHRENYLIIDDWKIVLKQEEFPSLDEDSEEETEMQVVCFIIPPNVTAVEAIVDDGNYCTDGELIQVFFKQYVERKLGIKD